MVGFASKIFKDRRIFVMKTKEEAFLNWLVSHGAKFPLLDWPSVKHHSRGAAARSHIKPGETIIEIPEICMISEDTAHRDPFLGFIYRNHPRLFRRDDHVLTVFLMYQQNLGTDSFYYDYLQVLPIPETPSNWSEYELNQLQHPELSENLKKKSVHVAKIYQEIFSELTKFYPESFSWKSYTLTDFEEMWNVIQSRSFGRRLPWTALVPLADCLNHSNVATKYAFNQKNESGSFRLYTCGKNFIKKGSEVFNSYGRKGNMHLLFDYGFVMKDNQWNSFNLFIYEQLRPSCIDSFRKLLRIPNARLLLKGVGLLGKQSFQLNYFQPISIQFLCWHRILAMHGNDIEILASSNYDFLEPYSECNEKEAIRSMILNIEHVIQSFPTNIEEDQELLHTESNDRILLAIRYRVSMKQLLCEHLHIYYAMFQIVSGDIPKYEKLKEDSRLALEDYSKKIKSVLSQSNFNGIRTSDDSIYYQNKVKN